MEEKKDNVVVEGGANAGERASEVAQEIPVSVGGVEMDPMDPRILSAQLQPLVVFLYAVLPPQAVLHFAKMILNTVASASVDQNQAPPEVIRWFQDQGNRCRSALSVLDSIISVVPAGGSAQVMRVAPPGQRQRGR